MGHENAVITQVGEGMNEWKVATVSAWHPR
jgi:hypothetical protein